jgi:hypothetical protein
LGGHHRCDPTGSRRSCIRPAAVSSFHALFQEFPIMAGLYAATYSGTITNAGGTTDIGSFSPADDVPIRLRGFLISQISEVGDAAEEGVRINLNRLPATMTVGSGGAAITATKPLSDYNGGSTWTMTARANDTTLATSSGTAEVLMEIGWNERNSPYDFFFPDERFCPMIKQSGANLTGLTLTQQTTVADDYSGLFTFWIEELG